MHRLLVSLFISLLACCFLALGIAQETEPEAKPTVPIYESVVFPDRSLLRRFEQADRLIEAGRINESAQLLGGILENVDAVFLKPEESADEPARTLRLTINDHLITRIRNLPREARESYAFQFEPTARRLLDNAVLAGSLDGVQQVARKYFPTPSGASAAFLVALTQYERGDYAAAFLTVEKLKRLHPAIPEALAPALEQMFGGLQDKLENAAERPLPEQLQSGISESAWLEQIGWRIPSGSPAQNTGTRATIPLLEKNWTVPIFTRLFNERETDAISRLLANGNEVHIPAAQPLLVGDRFITRTFGDTIAVDANTGKRLWVVSEPEYHFPSTVTVPPLQSSPNLRATLRLFFWHNRIAQQLSSDGERLFCVDGHDFQVDLRQFARIPNLAGRGEDLRYGTGNTLTARDVKTGRIHWQIGKFPYVQKYIDALFALPRGQQDVDATIFTDVEKKLKETWFLGAPLPLYGRLYVIGESDGVLQLFVLESQTGNLLAQQALAHVPSSIALNLPRRAYPLFPSASGGIVICPTGNGLVVALDATTLSPVWCFSYVSGQVSPDEIRRMPNPRLGVQIMNINENNFRYLFAEGGWQVPCMIIDERRVLVAPPDRAALYCLDLLSGKLLWEQPVPRPNSLYVACVYDDKVFAVTPTDLLVFDMNTGKEVATHQARFPSSLRPAGVGVHSGSQYFIPFTNGLMAVADLDGGKLTWLDASGLANPPVSEEEVSADATTDDPTLAPIGAIFLNRPQGNKPEIFTPDLVADDIFQRPIRFGNLVGIKGRFFSQSPTQIASFDQKEPLRQRAEALLQADPNNPEGLLHRGRLLKSEGKLSEAIDSFRASWRSHPTPEAADALRRNLLDAMRSDYSAWADAGQELESLAESPDERGIVLYAQMEGILQSGTANDLIPVLERVFAFGYDPTILIPVSNDHSVQLHRALGGLIDQGITKGNRRAWRSTLEEIAETFFQRLTENSTGVVIAQQTSALASQWFRNTVYLPHDIQRWSMFALIFRNTRVAEKARQILHEEYERYRLPIALDLQEETSVVKKWSELCVPFVWKSGVVDVKHTTAIASSVPVQDADARNDIDRNISRLLNIARNPNISARFTGNQQTIPFLGAPDSELATRSYVMGSWTSGAAEFFLYCYDPSGQELWRLALPSTKYMETSAVNLQSGEQVLYVKGCSNFLLLVLSDSITAIDVSQQSEAKILWSKTLSSMLVSQQSSRSRNPDQKIALNEGFPKNSVFVSPHVIAVWDSGFVYGLEPLTGQTLWIRKITHEKCSILGDNENLFLVFPDAKHVVAVDPTSGKELADCPLPGGTTFFVYGRNIVFAQRTATSDQYAFYVCDLLDIHNKRERALDPTNMLPANLLFDKLPRNTTLVQMLHGDRFLSVARWGTKLLQIYDLQTKKKLFPDENTLLTFVSEGSTGTMRCDVEFVEDSILVLFTKDINMRAIQDSSQGTDVTTQQIYFNPVNGVQGMSIGKGEMMLFDTLGKPCWSEPTKIEAICRLFDVSDRLPVKLFAVSVQTRVSRNSENKNTFSTKIIGVDKRTGELRINARTPENERQSLQMFRVIVNAEEQEITFATIHPPEMMRVRFTDEAETLDE